MPMNSSQRVAAPEQLDLCDPQAALNLPLRLRVAAKTKQALDVVAFRLVGEPGEALPGFSAGAHIDVQAGAGVVRQYSLCNPAAKPLHYEIAVLREPASRGGSRFMHEALAQGASIWASRPRNHFPLDERAPALLLAGGIGITPILAMARQLAEQGRSFDLHYCARSRARAAFLDDLRAAPYAHRVHAHFDDGEASQKLDMRATLAEASADCHLYVCGPAGFIEHVLGAAKQAGWADERMHREYFAAPVSASPSEAGDGSFELELARSGRSVTVANGQTALAALLEAGIDVSASCEAGVCGTCVTRVIEGLPDHRDVYLTDAEHARNDCFTPCCSRARSPKLVIDL